MMVGVGWLVGLEAGLGWAGWVSVRVLGLESRYSERKTSVKGALRGRVLVRKTKIDLNFASIEFQSCFTEPWLNSRMKLS